MEVFSTVIHLNIIEDSRSHNYNIPNFNINYGPNAPDFDIRYIFNFHQFNHNYQFLNDYNFK
jgi:hypothetical protein